MEMPFKINSQEDCVRVLREHGVSPTSQRIEIGLVLLACPAHLSAEEVYDRVNSDGRRQVSKATVYNTLALFVEKGLVREVIADPSKVFYDPNTTPHHHFYDVSAGSLTDIDGNEVDVVGLPPLPEGTRLEGVDVVVRLRRD
jgi:Fur family iron response transcriptional regulator